MSTNIEILSAKVDAIADLVTRMADVMVASLSEDDEPKAPKAKTARKAKAAPKPEPVEKPKTLTKAAFVALKNEGIVPRGMTRNEAWDLGIIPEGYVRPTGAMRQHFHDLKEADAPKPRTTRKPKAEKVEATDTAEKVDALVSILLASGAFTETEARHILGIA